MLTYVTLALGLLLCAALAGGVLGRYVRLPRVTSYLLTGVALGSLRWVPEQLGWLSQEEVEATLEALGPLTKLAIALVLFNLGCHFPLPKARRFLGRALKLSAGEMGVTFVLVTAGLLLLRAAPAEAILLGALALATAPATTILVLKEAESEGPITQYTGALVAINNLASIVLFELLFIAVVFLRGQLDQSPLVQIGHLLLDLVGSAGLGILAGLATSYCYGLVGENRRLALLVGLVVLLLGICMALGVPYLLTFLAMGLTVANSSYHTRQILAELDRLTGLLAVVFFVTHGADLRVDLLLKVGTVGVGYLIFRLLGKYLGTRLAGRTVPEGPNVRRWLGTALMAQAGAAIALAEIAVSRTESPDNPLHDLFLNVQTIILGTVVVFEIAGPLLIRQAVIRGGEVPLAHAIRHGEVSLFDQFRTLANSLLIAFGFDPWHRRSEEDMTVRDIMRKNVVAVPQSATFAELVEHIEHSRDNTFPVVADLGALTGVIRYRELSNALFDQALGPLVRAADLATPTRRVLRPDDPISRASELFAASKDDCIPVISGDEPERLLGIVRRRDVLRKQIRDQTGSGGGGH